MITIPENSYFGWIILAHSKAVMSDFYCFALTMIFIANYFATLKRKETICIT